jgi:hypothetical protein
MKTFKQYISEIFDNPYKYNLYRFDNDDTRAYFIAEEDTGDSEDKLFSVNIVGNLTIGGRYMSEVGFSTHAEWLSDMQGAGYKFEPNENPPFSEGNIIDYIDWSYGTDKKLNIDTKDVGRIFATVIKITEEYYDRYKPNVLYFRAKNAEANRVTLYNKMAKRFARKYNLELEIKTFTEFTQFNLIKK